MSAVEQSLCGSVAGQQAHVRRGEIACDDCLMAGAEKQRWVRARDAVGMPRRRRGMGRANEPSFQHERPSWSERADLAGLRFVGAYLHESVRWSA